MANNAQSNFGGWVRSRTGLVCLGFLFVAVLFLWEAHRAHILGILPYALFLLCPLLHLFHSGHGGHGGTDEQHKNHRYSSKSVFIQELQMEETPVYGLWPLVVINSLVFIVFAFSFTKPRTARDWRSFSAFSAFIVALFAEMYGFPLTIYVISGWLMRRYPGLDPFSHDAGHLWNTLLGWKINPHFDPLHMLSNILIFAGFILLSAAWKVLYDAQKSHTLAISGPYAYVRHPQYDGFILIMLGFLFQWRQPSSP